MPLLSDMQDRFGDNNDILFYFKQKTCDQDKEVFFFSQKGFSCKTVQESYNLNP